MLAQRVRSTHYPWSKRNWLKWFSSLFRKDQSVHPYSGCRWICLSCVSQASPVAQQWRICLPMQEARAWFLGQGRSPGRGNGNPLQYFCLENPMERRAWQTTVHGLAQSQPRLSAHSPSLTLAPTTGGRRSSQTAEGVASKSKERKFSSNSVALNNGSKKKKKPWFCHFQKNCAFYWSSSTRFNLFCWLTLLGNVSVSYCVGIYERSWISFIISIIGACMCSGNLRRCCSS